MSEDGNVRYRKDRKVWGVNLKWQGKKHFFSTYKGIPCETERLAERLLDVIRGDIERRTFSPDRYKKSAPLHLKKYSELWLDGLDVQAATLKDYKNSLNRHVLPVLGHEFLPDIDYTKLKSLQAGIKRGPKGAMNVMNCLYALLREAKREGHISQVPELPKALKIHKKPIRWINAEDQWKIIDHLKPEDRPVFLFMKLTGCRPSEARALQKRDIRPDCVVFQHSMDPYENLKGVKNNEPMTFPMTEALAELLAQAPQNLTSFVFLNPRTRRPYTKNINRIWNRACTKAGLDYHRFPLNNCNRHSFASQAIKQGIPKDVVSRLLRHKDKRSVDVYADYEAGHLAAVVSKVQKLPTSRQPTGNQKVNDKK